MRIAQGTRVIVTGAARGIGKALAESLIRRGAIVGINTRGNDVILPLETTNDNAVTLNFDVRDFVTASRAIDEFGTRFGGIDLLINNAGVGGRPQFLMRATQATLDEIIETNLTGSIYCTHATLPHMKSAGGKIIFISSMAASVPMVGVTAYAASKGGLEVFARCLDAEYRRKGITGLAIRLGPVRTRMTRHLETVLPQMLSPEEAAEHCIRLIEAGGASVLEEVGCQDVSI